MISIIVPIYKVENYIERCVRSLLEQTYTDIEYIFVDDCSPDNSVSILEEIVEEYPSRINQIRIISHEENMGLPAARNTGLKVAIGDYIFHCDSDDYVKKDMIEKMYQTAKEKDADIVWCDWYLSFAKSERYMKQPEYQTSEEALKSILSGSMKYNVWNKLVKRDLYIKNNISFPTGHGMAEDMTMIRLFACARSVAYLPEAFYHYVRLNENAFTMNQSPKQLQDILYNTNETIDYIHQKFGDSLNREIAYFKLNVKFPFLIANNKKTYKLWTKWYPEANQYIMSNKSISLRSRLLQHAASQKMFLLVWLYYKIVHKLIYGFIYK
jgi:glycosyltransferase involved in cell wall biosynthesis